MHLDWGDLDPTFRQRIAESDPEAAKALAIWEEASKLPKVISNEERKADLERIKDDLLHGKYHNPGYQNLIVKGLLETNKTNIQVSIELSRAPSPDQWGDWGLKSGAGHYENGWFTYSSEIPDGMEADDYFCSVVGDGWHKWMWQEVGNE